MGPLYAKWRPEPPSIKAVSPIVLALPVAMLLVGLMLMADSFTGLATDLQSADVIMLLAMVIAGVGLMSAGLTRIALFGADKPVGKRPFEGTYDAPGELLQFASQVKLSVESVEYGSDLGVISFSNGWLHFQGRTTEFHLDSGSARGRLRTSIDGRSCFVVHFFEPDFTGTANIYPVTVDLRPSSRTPKAMQWQFTEWQESPKAGRSLFPPRRAQSQFVRTAGLRSAKCLWVGGVTAVFGAALGTLSWLSEGRGTVAASLFLVIAATSYCGAARWGMASRLLAGMAESDRSRSDLNRELRRVRWAMFFRPRHWLPRR